MLARFARAALLSLPFVLIASQTAAGQASSWTHVVVQHDHPLTGSEARGDALDRHGIHVERVRSDEADDEIREWRSRPGVRTAYEAVSFEAAFTPNDPIWDLQWESMQMEVDLAWDTTLGDRAVVIAILDTGLDPFIPDLQGKVAPGGHDYVNNDGNPADDDPDRHGTNAAMVAASRADDDSNNAGFCPRCRILPMKVLDALGGGIDPHIAAAIIDATDLGADIINMSLAGEGTSAVLDDAIDYAASKGVLIVAAAGNEDTSSVQFPAGDPDVVGVAGVRLPDEPDCGVGGAGPYPVGGTEPKCSFSNYGSWVSVAAQGCHVTTFQPPSGASIFCGTSASSPAVAGTAGLLASLCPNLSGPDLRDRLESTSLDIIPDVAGLPVALHGRVSPPGLVASASPALCPDNGFVLRQFSFTRTVLTTTNGSSCTTTSCTNLRLQLRERISASGFHGHLFVIMGYSDGVLPRQGPRFTNNGNVFFADHTAVRDDVLRSAAKADGACTTVGDVDLEDIAGSWSAFNAYRTADAVDAGLGSAADPVFFKHGLKVDDQGLDSGDELFVPLLAITGIWHDDGDGIAEAGEIDCHSSTVTSVVYVQD